MTEHASPQSGRYARELTSLAVAPVLIWFIGWVPWAVVATTILVAFLALWEFLVLGEHKGYPMQKWVCIVLAAIVLAAFLVPGMPLVPAIVLVILAIPAIYALVRIDLAEALPASAICAFAVLYVALTAGALIRLRLDFEPHGGDLIFFLLMIVWSNDAGAYYVGKNFGRTPLAPRVSPKKTVEGGVGGLITALLAATAIHYTFFPEFPLVHALAAALLLSVTGAVGDLAESVWKRSAGVKDSGSLIPGHGGFLDRVDSVFFTAPILYSYWALLTHGLDWLK